MIWKNLDINKYDLFLVDLWGTVHDGKNHEIKKIFESVNHNVIKLKRESIGFIDLTGLKSGEKRKLTSKEIKQLYAYSNDIKRK